MEHARGGSGRTFQAAGAAPCSCQPSIGNAICEHAAAAMGWRRGAGCDAGDGSRRLRSEANRQGGRQASCFAAGRCMKRATSGHGEGHAGDGTSGGIRGGVGALHHGCTGEDGCGQHVLVVLRVDGARLLQDSVAVWGVEGVDKRGKCCDKKGGGGCRRYIKCKTKV